MLDLRGIPVEAAPSEAPRAQRIEVWGTAIGAWGDCLACLGEFVNWPGRGGMLHYGSDPNIVRFVRCQPGIDAAVQIEPYCREEDLALRIQSAAQEDWPLPVRMLEVGAIARTHLRPSVLRARTVHRWHGARLDRAAHEAAENVAPSGPFFLLQPYSAQSSSLETHWPHWQAALALLLTYTPYTYLLVGQGYPVCGEHPRLINRVDQLPDMMSVFALAERAEGIVSTCNSLALYAAIQKIPAVVCANRALMASPFFTRWIDTEPVTLLDYGADTFRFMEAMIARFRL